LTVTLALATGLLTEDACWPPGAVEVVVMSMSGNWHLVRVPPVGERGTAIDLAWACPRAQLPRAVLLNGLPFYVTNSLVVHFAFIGRPNVGQVCPVSCRRQTKPS
jgi:hypothetical protein